MDVMEVVKLYIGADENKDDIEYDIDASYKKINADEALKDFLKVFPTHRNVLYPGDIEHHIENALKTSLEKEVTNFDAWSYIQTDRPSKEKAEEYRSKFNPTTAPTPASAIFTMISNAGVTGTDMRVITYENDSWGREDMGLRVSIFVEFGKVIGYFLDIDFDQEFFF